MFLYLRRGCRAAVALPVASRVNAALQTWSHALVTSGVIMEEDRRRGHWCRADSRFAPSQWDTALLCNNISHWHQPCWCIVGIWNEWGNIYKAIKNFECRYKIGINIWFILPLWSLVHGRWGWSSKLVISIDSDNGLALDRHQAIIWVDVHYRLKQCEISTVVKTLPCFPLQSKKTFFKIWMRN